MNYILYILLYALVCIVYLFWDFLNLNTATVSKENATAALERLSDWAKWMVGIETGAIAAMGFLIQDTQFSQQLIDLGFWVLLFLGSSTLLTASVLASLPSLQIRLSDNASEGNDIYDQKSFAFETKKDSGFIQYIRPFTGVRFGKLAGLVHIQFAIGIVLFAYFVFKTQLNSHHQKETNCCCCKKS